MHKGTILKFLTKIWNPIMSKCGRQCKYNVKLNDYWTDLQKIKFKD
jgi:hypothetical protein